jgi:hypothetical protein
MRLHVDAWDPGYGASMEAASSAERGGPAAASSAQLDADVEVPARDWAPRDAAPGACPPDVVLLVDGVRRIDARIWVTDDEGGVHPGLAASYAAGVVRCDLARGVAEVGASTIARGLFTPASGAPGVESGAVRYRAYPVKRGEPADLVLGVQEELRLLEAEVATAARRDDADALLVVDGPLRGRAHLAHVLGYIKSHRVEYLPPELTAVVTRLGAGQRSPVFRLGTSWHRYSWYLRLPGTGGGPWNGIVRVECSFDQPAARAVELADVSAVTLPRFASSPYKDPRAPQNLIPVAGLERRLRALLGDPRLLHRALVRAAAATA